MAAVESEAADPTFAARLGLGVLIVEGVEVAATLQILVGGTNLFLPMRVFRCGVEDADTAQTNEGRQIVSNMTRVQSFIRN